MCNNLYVYVTLECQYNELAQIYGQQSGYNLSRLLSNGVIFPMIWQHSTLRIIFIRHQIHL